MKLKHILLTAVMALFAVCASAKSVDEIKIYINPGHGSWGPNNRHMATIGHSPISSTDPDTTDFYESNTNLQKGLWMFHRLVDYGFKNTDRNALDLTQNVVMSHVKCGPYPYTGSADDSGNEYNRTLSEIAAEAETWGADQFVSIHSNAATEGNTVNYLYFAYDGYGSDADKNALSAEMSRLGWNHRILDRHTKWTHYDYTMTADDLAAGKGKIGSQKLGVLNHDCPGYLVEGYFHTYQPARHRGMNFDVDRLEGLTYAWGVADYWGVEKESDKGNIYGIVRDRNTKFTHDLYNPNASTTDVYLPLNEITVNLKQGEDVVATYTTDVNYNGAYVFKDVAPGDYTLEFVSDQYKTDYYTSPSVNDLVETVNVSVTAATITYNEVFLENVDYVPPTIVYENYPDSTAGKGFSVLPKYEFSGSSDATLASLLEGKTIRRQILRDNMLYVLAVDAENAPSVYVYDTDNKSVSKTLGTSAASGDILALSDIAMTADGYLVGINKANQAFGGSANMKAYKWENDESGIPDGELADWWTLAFAGNWTNGIGGESLTYSGTLAEGKFIYTGTTTASSGNTRLVIASISDGEYVGYYRNNQIENVMCYQLLDETYNITVSPLGDDRIVFNSVKSQPFEIQLNTADVGVPTLTGQLSDGLLDVASVNESYFKYAEHSWMVAPAIEDGSVCGVSLIDITNGLDNATATVLEGASIEPVSYTNVLASGELALTLNTADVCTDATIELFLNVDGTVHKFVEGDNYVSVTPATGTANPYAYALESTFADGVLTVNYALNAAATDVNIYVVDSEGEAVANYAAGALDAGKHSAEINVSTLDAGTYTWEVEVDGEVKSAVETFSSYRFYHPRGVDVDNNMESPSFGNVYVTEGMKTSSSTYWSGNGGGLGLYAYDAAMNPITNPATGNYAFTGGWTLNPKAGSNNTADFARVRVAEDGRLFVSRINDTGDYILYADSFEDLYNNNSLKSLFSGYTFDASTYKYTDADGNFIGAANIAFDVKGSGEDLKMMTLSSNINHWSYVFSGVSSEEYDLGTAEVLPVPTVVEAFTGRYTIAPQCTGIDYDDRGGVWYCQYRATPTDAQPGLVYLDAEGNEIYKDLVVHAGGGVRLSPNGEKLIVGSAKNLLTVYDLVWAADGTPALYKDYVITHNIGLNVYDIAWDLANNFYICGNSGEYLKAFALPREEAVTTKAASKYAFTVQSTGVDGISVDNENVPAVYYNLNGIQVGAENMVPGVYIEKKGNVTRKVVVK